MAARLMLERKGIEYRRVDLMPVIHKAVLKASGFDDVTVPALRLDGQRLQGSRTISRALDALQPEPPLFPREPEAREAVERAEAWGDEVYQPAARRLSWATLKRDHSEIGSFAQDARLGIPTELATRTAAPIVIAAAKLNHANDDSVQLDLQRLPGWLDRIDGWLEEGVLDSHEPNAADYQIATTTRLMLCLDDLRPAIEERPAGRHAMQIVPHFPGRLSRVLPQEWLAPLQRSAVPA